MPEETLLPMLSSIDGLWEEHRTRSSDGFLHMFDFFKRDTAFLRLFDNERILPALLGILGWNIYSYHAHLDVNPPTGKENAPQLTWHRDNSQMNRDLSHSIHPILAVKASFWFSDASSADRGNLLVIPGSHTWDYAKIQTMTRESTLKDAVSVMAEPGDAVIFDVRILHTRSNNFSHLTRKAIFIGYAYRWLRPRDSVQVHLDELDHLNPIRRQLLNRDMDESAYVPENQDVPLKDLYSDLYPEIND